MVLYQEGVKKEKKKKKTKLKIKTLWVQNKQKKENDQYFGNDAWTTQDAGWYL